MRAKPCPPLSKAHVAKPCPLPVTPVGVGPGLPVTPVTLPTLPVRLKSTIGDGPVTPQAPQEDRVAFARMPRGVTVGRQFKGKDKGKTIMRRIPQGAPIASSSVSEEPSRVHPSGVEDHRAPRSLRHRSLKSHQGEPSEKKARWTDKRDSHSPSSDWMMPCSLCYETDHVAADCEYFEEKGPDGRTIWSTATASMVAFMESGSSVKGKNKGKQRKPPPWRNQTDAPSGLGSQPPPSDFGKGKKGGTGKSKRSDRDEQWRSNERKIFTV